jgi:hypothetical protein
VIVVVSKSAVDSTWVKQEVNMAAARSHFFDKIIPLCLDDTKLEAVNPFLLDKQAIVADEKKKFLSELLRSIK